MNTVFKLFFRFPPNRKRMHMHKVLNLIAHGCFICHPNPNPHFPFTYYDYSLICPFQGYITYSFYSFLNTSLLVLLPKKFSCLLSCFLSSFNPLVKIWDLSVSFLWLFSSLVKFFVWSFLHHSSRHKLSVKCQQWKTLFTDNGMVFYIYINKIQH